MPVKLRPPGSWVHEGHTSWLDVPAEKVIIEARVESADEDETRMRQAEEGDAVMAALRELGYAPPRPEDWVEGEFSDGDDSTTSRIDNVDTADDADHEG